MNRSEVLHRYTIRGGTEGKERLDLLARVMLPTTSQLLNRAGCSWGMKCLDVGCGGGHGSLLIASMVGAQGRVVGTDTDNEIIELAKEDAKIARGNNVEFRHLDACIHRWHDEYDLIYARFLLSHLSQPETCLRAMMKACKVHGIIVVEDIDFTGSFCYPACPAYERYVELYQNV